MNIKCSGVVIDTTEKLKRNQQKTCPIKEDCELYNKESGEFIKGKYDFNTDKCISVYGSLQKRPD